MSFGIINARMLDICARDVNTAVIDLRSAAEYARGHVKNAVHMDMDNYEKMIRRYDTSTALIFYCDRGSNSMVAARRASELGYNAKSVIGGYQSYVHAG